MSQFQRFFAPWFVKPEPAIDQKLKSFYREFQKRIGTEPPYIFVSIEEQDAYYQWLTDQKRYPNTLNITLPSGEEQSGLDFYGIPVIAKKNG